MQNLNITSDRIKEICAHFIDFNLDELAMDTRYFDNHNSSAFVTGLTNFNNNCYINSIIQCLNGCKPFVEYMYSILVKYNSIVFQTEFRLLNRYLRYMFDYNKNLEQRNFEYKNLIEAFFETFNNFTYGDQEDANEFLIAFIDYIHKCAEKIDKIVALSLDRPEYNLNSSLINNISSISIKDVRRCDVYKIGSSIIEEKSSILSMAIRNSNGSECFSLNDVLDNYFSLERIQNEEDLRYCEICDTKTSYKRKYYICNVPKIIIIQLKRFQVQFFYHMHVTIN